MRAFLLDNSFDTYADEFSTFGMGDAICLNQSIKYHKPRVKLGNTRKRFRSIACDLGLR